MQRLIITLAIVAPLVGACAALPVKLAADAAHDRTVIATVEQAAKRYSVILNGKQDCFLYPELYTPRIPMFTLDEAYR